MPPRSVSDRQRSPPHRWFVGSLCCVVCGRPPPNDAHHLKFAQPRAMSLKSGDQFCVPLCRRCHGEVELAGDELAWWQRKGIDPLPLAGELWARSEDLRSGYLLEIKGNG